MCASPFRVFIRHRNWRSENFPAKFLRTRNFFNDFYLASEKDFLAYILGRSRAKFLPRSRRDLAKIVQRFQKTLSSRRDSRDLAENAEIAPQSRRDCAEN